MGGKVIIYDNYIKVYNNEKVLFIDNDSNITSARELFKDNKLFGIQKDGKWGFETKDGQNVVPCTYDFITEFNRFGFAGVKENGKWGVLDRNGKVILEEIYEFEEDIKPEFLGKYYKTYNENNEIYYTDMISDEIYED